MWPAPCPRHGGAGPANAGFAASYGDDESCARAADLIRGLLDADAEVRFVASGTAANALTLAALAAPHEAVICHSTPTWPPTRPARRASSARGLGLIRLPGASGRIDPAALAAVLAQPKVAYRQSPAALTLTNATEYGAVYSEATLAALIGQAKAAGLKTHLDGARLANAVAAGSPRRLAPWAWTSPCWAAPRPAPPPPRPSCSSTQTSPAASTPG